MAAPIIAAKYDETSPARCPHLAEADLFRGGRERDMLAEDPCGDAKGSPRNRRLTKLLKRQCSVIGTPSRAVNTMRTGFPNLGTCLGDSMFAYSELFGFLFGFRTRHVGFPKSKNSLFLRGFVGRSERI